MAMGIFRFKQFCVDDSGCAMKTGTDAVLLGSWVPLPDQGKVLDVGCGSGIIGMMIAQRNQSLHITGIEIDPEAARQASKNLIPFPFSQTLEIVCDDVRKYVVTSKDRFDLIVSNPPYFSGSLLGKLDIRNKARHDTTLTHHQLVAAAGELLLPEGLLGIVLPFDTFEQFRGIASSGGLYLHHRLDVQHRPGSEPVRTLAMLGSHRKVNPESSTLVLYTSDGRHHPDYLGLTKEFYLFA